jgi:hypothetical protein
MIGHQAIGPDFDIILLATLSHKMDVMLIVFILEEGLLTSITSLNDMVRTIWND